MARLRRFALVAIAAGACKGGDSSSSPSPSPAPATAPIADAAVAMIAPDAAPPPAHPTETLASPNGHDFIAEARALFRIAACGDGDLPKGADPAIVDKNCAQIRAIQATYRDHWLVRASQWFAAHVPKDVPKKVVYPFAGGDLSTALTVYPDADEITTISLEPAGDARSVDDLTGNELSRALDEQRKELKFLYTVDFSNTMNLIDSMREGRLPGQLVFSLNALRVHGLEPVALYYFHVEPDGSLRYVTDDDVAHAGDPRTVQSQDRNSHFSNMELRFRTPGETRVRVYRHIRWNLDDDHLKDGRLIEHLAAKGQVAGMTKAASYLLSWPTFSTMRRYLLEHVVWMVSDATGIPPDVAAPAGFKQETYGMFDGPHIPAGNSAKKAWIDLFKSAPVRELPFRFGYPDNHKHRHLVITYKTA
ncbi:MAG TPA: hypothetical protein VL463_16285 [Kofleriaceae bacterium]|nr:hypothetical protein [Kofleriaceae bacterium]